MVLRLCTEALSRNVNFEIGHADITCAVEPPLNYRKPKPQAVITSLADSILKEEGSGVLNWELNGLKRLRDNNWRFGLTENQKELIDKVVLQSDSPRQFVKRCLIEEPDCLLTLDDCFGAYIAFCKTLGWLPMSGHAVPGCRWGRVAESCLPPTSRSVCRSAGRDPADNPDYAE